MRVRVSSLLFQRSISWHTVVLQMSNVDVTEFRAVRVRRTDTAFEWSIRCESPSYFSVTSSKKIIVSTRVPEQLCNDPRISSPGFHTAKNVFQMHRFPVLSA